MLYTRSSAGFYGRDATLKPELRIYDLKERKETTLFEKTTGYALSMEGNKVIVRKDGGGYDVLDATPKGKDSAKTLSLKGMQSDIVPAEEWATMFDEVWRRYRDFFYVTNMHGYDWEALGKQYRDLLPYVGHRSDLNYVFGEMVAELNVGHAYITGGDWEAPERHQVALPGARFEWDAGAKHYRIARILRGENEEDRYRAPLTEVGVDARVGDYVLEVDGIEPRADEDIYKLLRDKSDRAGDVAPERQARARRRARSYLQAHHQRIEPELPRHGAHQPRQGDGGDTGTSRLHPHSEHGRRGHLRIHQDLLRPNPQRRLDRRRPQQRWRQRLADDHRTLAPRIVGTRYGA